jgi:hypothetical protein
MERGHVGGPPHQTLWGVAAKGVAPGGRATSSAHAYIRRGSPSTHSITLAFALPPSLYLTCGSGLLERAYGVWELHHMHAVVLLDLGSDSSFSTPLLDQSPRNIVYIVCV